MELTIVRIKPNPAGKDRPAYSGPTAEQLAAEWVDFRNDSGRDADLTRTIHEGSDEGPAGLA